MYIVYFVFMDLYISGFLSNIASNSFYESKGNEENTFKLSFISGVSRTISSSGCSKYNFQASFY